MALNSFYDNFSSLDANKGIVGDFTHASALYRRNNFRLAPKNRFLYHIVIDVNTTALSTLGSSVYNILNKREFNLLASSADLPSYSIATETLQQYNRKKVIQTMINYNEVGIEFHDDNAGLTTLLWEAYYRYYYQDGNYTDQSSRPRSYATKLYDTDISNTYRHGFNRRRTTDIPFFNSITIHQLHPQNKQSTFTSFTLVNPLITEWSHDRVDQADASGVMKNNMRLAYETVLYDREITSSENIQSFGDIQHYDTVPSPYNSVSTSSIAKNTNDNTFWEEIFKDLLSNIVDLTGFNSQQRQSQLPLSVQPITQTTNPPANTTNFFPSQLNQNITTFAQPVSLQTQNFNLSNQEFRRQLQNNPQKLADYGKDKSVKEISILTGRNIQESKQFYDDLSPNVKTQIEQAALEETDNVNFVKRLSELGVITGI
jgi:hypothetical protein